MRRLRELVLVSSLLALGACSDGTGPRLAERLPAPGGLHSLRWAHAEAATALALRRDALPATGLSAPRFSVQSNVLTAPATLSANQVKFWAYASQATSVEVDYQAADGTSQPYVRFDVPAGALLKRPDGSLVLPGDSVQITMVLDTVEIRLDLEPTGLQFNPLIPATLTVWYAGSNPDLNGDGVVNFLDSVIERELLGVYTQEDITDPWIGIPAVQDLLGKSFTAQLRHFSGYAVSW